LSVVEFDAAILPGVGRPLEIGRLTIAELAPDDVLVRIIASGLCHTDLEVIEGSLAYPMPIVLGHEGAGVVEAVGADVSSVKVGDHVVCSWNPHCGHCFYCERDQPILCEPFTRHQPRGHLLDGRSRLSCAGAEVHHFSVVSSHAQYAVVPRSGAIPVPREIPFDDGRGSGDPHRAGAARRHRRRDRLRCGRPQCHPGCAPGRRRHDHRHRPRPGPS
jgi:S-(hydroxymethyl)glutathione dehydrogenase/alcohol dehydrogenase